jgi:hypothetical protein
VFDSFTTLEGISFESSGDRIDFCLADAAQIRDIYVIDLDGTMRPAGSAISTGSATLVSDEPNMLSFVDASKCTLRQDNCYSYCRGTCFRTVRYQVEPAGNYRLKVCSARSTGNCIFLTGRTRSDDPTFAKRLREFVVHLPSGTTYDATFVTSAGVATWPSFADVSYDPALCPEAFQVGAVRLVIPPISNSTCSSLIRNGNFQASNTVPTSWLHNDGGITLVTGRGVGGTNAAAGIERGASTTFFQFIDNRCMDTTIGQFYELTASIKLTNSDGSIFTCNPSRQACPDIGVHTNTGGFQRVATVSSSIQNGFQVAHGFVQIDNNIATAGQVAMYVRSQVNGKLMIVDDVSMKLQVRNCNNLIRASNMETDEWKSLWQRSDVSGAAGIYTTATPGYNSANAFRYGNRKTSAEGPLYSAFRNIETQCLQPNTKWRITAQFKLIQRSNGQGVSCTIRQRDSCPSVQISIRNDDRVRFYAPIFNTYTNSVWKADTYNQFQADFVLPNTDVWDGSIRTVQLQMRDFPVAYDVFVDDVTWSPIV